MFTDYSRFVLGRTFAPRTDNLVVVRRAGSGGGVLLILPLLRPHRLAFVAPTLDASQSWVNLWKKLPQSDPTRVEAPRTSRGHYADNAHANSEWLIDCQRRRSAASYGIWFVSLGQTHWRPARPAQSVWKRQPPGYASCGSSSNSRPGRASRI